MELSVLTFAEHAHGSVLDPQHEWDFFSHENLHTNVCNSSIHHRKSLGRTQIQGADNQRNRGAIHTAKNCEVTDEQCSTHWAAWMRVQRIMQSGKGQFQGLTCCVAPFTKPLWNNRITEAENKLLIDAEETVWLWKRVMWGVLVRVEMSYDLMISGSMPWLWGVLSFCKMLASGKAGKSHGDLHMSPVISAYRSITAK